MVDKVPGAITAGVAKRGSRVHATEATINLSRSHLEENISRLQSAAQFHDAALSYIIGDLVNFSGVVYFSTTIIPPEPFNPTKWNNVAQWIQSGGILSLANPTNKVAIKSTTAQADLQVGSDAGHVAINGAAKEFAVYGTGNIGTSFLAGLNADINWFFGDAGNSGNGNIKYQNLTKTMSFLPFTQMVLVLKGQTQRAGIKIIEPLSDLDIFGSVGFKIKNSAVDVNSAQETTIRITDTTLVRTVTLLNSDTVLGRTYFIKNATDTNNIIVATQGAQTFDGATTLTIVPRGGAIIQCDGTNWDVIAKT